MHLTQQNNLSEIVFHLRTNYFDFSSHIDIHFAHCIDLIMYFAQPHKIDGTRVWKSSVVKYSH